MHLHFCNRYGPTESGWEPTASPFTVVRWRVRILSVSYADGGEPMFLQRDRVTEFVSENGVSVSGWIATDEGWGPDAKVELTVGGVIVSIAKHTEGRGESGNAMLDLAVSGLASVVVPVCGWLGVAGSEGAGEAPPECRGARAPLRLVLGVRGFDRTPR